MSTIYPIILASVNFETLSSFFTKFFVTWICLVVVESSQSDGSHL